MTKKHFIALADWIIEHNKRGDDVFTDHQLSELAAFQKLYNSKFKTERWLDYIAGRCGPNGGAVK